MKKISIFLLAICCLVMVGCQDKNKKAKEEANVIIQEYIDGVNALVTSKGYTVEEIVALQPNQKVDKDYDNAVLERFGKIQVNTYKVTGSWNDGLMEGPFDIDEVKMSPLNVEEFTNQELHNYYDDSKHYNKSTATITDRIILDYTYIDSEQLSWKVDDTMEGSGVAPSTVDPSVLEKVKLNKLAKEAIINSDGEEETSLKYPTLIAIE